MFSAVQRYLILGLVALACLLGFGWTLHAAFLKAELSSSQSTVKARDAEIKGQALHITALAGELDRAVSSNKEMTRAIADQNAKINDLMAESERVRKLADAAVAKAKADGVAWRRRYEKVLTAPPADPDDQCKSLDTRINEYIDLRAEK